MYLLFTVLNGRAIATAQKKLKAVIVPVRDIQVDKHCPSSRYTGRQTLSQFKIYR